MFLKHSLNIANFDIFYMALSFVQVLWTICGRFFCGPTFTPVEISESSQTSVHSRVKLCCHLMDIYVKAVARSGPKNCPGHVACNFVFKCLSPGSNKSNRSTRAKFVQWLIN